MLKSNVEAAQEAAKQAKDHRAKASKTVHPMLSNVIAAKSLDRALLNEGMGIRRFQQFGRGTIPLQEGASMYAAIL